MVVESSARSIVKAVSYRIVSSLVTGGIIFAVTQQGLLAIGVTIIDSAVKTLGYYLHERAWSLISFGRIEHPLKDINVRRPLSEQDKQLVRSLLVELGLSDESISRTTQSDAA